MNTHLIRILVCSFFVPLVCLLAISATSAKTELTPLLTVSAQLSAKGTLSDPEQGFEAFRAKDYNRAYDLLSKAFAADPGDFFINFYLGRAAFESGQYEMAVMVFDRAMMIRPSDPRVKLELARAYQRLGVNDMARRYCREVLQTDPPQAVKQNIEKFLAYIDRSEKRHFFSGSLALGFDWDDNVWSSPGGDTIRTRIGEISLTGPSAEEKEDMVFSARLNLNHTLSFPFSKSAWQTRGVFFHSIYEQVGALDTFFLDMETGPEFALGKGVAGVMATADYLELDGSEYSSALGVKAHYRYMVSPFLILWPMLSYENKSFELNSRRNADHLDLSLDAAFPFKGFWWGLSAGYARENARDDEFSYDRWTFRISANRDLGRGFSIFSSYELALSDYEEQPDLFDETRQDTIHYFDLGLKKIFWQTPDKIQSLAMTLGGRHTHADSSLELYDYNKNVVYSSLEYGF